MVESRNIITGIDIGTTKVVAVIAEYVQKEKNDKIEKYIEILGVGEHPSNGLKKGIVVDIEKTKTSLEYAIKEAEEKADCEIDDVFVGITGDHIKGINYTGKIPVHESSQISGIGSEITDKDVERVFEAARAINIPPGRRILHTLDQSFEVDDRKGIVNPIGLSGNTLGVNVHIIHSLINVEKDIETCFRRLGIKIRSFVLEPLASSFSVLDDNEKKLGVALIDIGGGTTDILVYFDGGIQHSSAISHAGQNITIDITHRFKTDFNQAEDLKHVHGIAKISLADDESYIDIEGVKGRESIKINQKMLAEVIEPRIKEILSLSLEEIKKSNFLPKLNFGIVITGGGSQLKNIVDLAQEIFNLPVRIGYPEKIKGLEKKYMDNPKYATAMGIIEYAIKEYSNVEYDSDSFLTGVKNLFYKSKKYITGWY